MIAADRGVQLAEFRRKTPPHRAGLLRRLFDSGTGGF
jgi:hypothetical protein